MYIPNGYAQVNLKWTGAALPHGAQVTYGVKIPSDMSPDEVAQVSQNAWNDCGIMANLSNQVGVTSVLVKNGPNATGPSAERANNKQGASQTAPVPPNTALLVRKNTTAGGHSGSGRFYIPGVVEGSSTGQGTYEPGETVKYQNAMNSFLNELIAEQTPMVLLHTQQDALLPELLVINLAVQSVMATQRRRMRG